MCKLFIAVNKTGKQSQRLKNILLVQNSEIKSQRDGIGALAVKHNGKVEFKKELSPSRYDEVLEWAEDRMDDSRLVAVHSRLGTLGSTTEKNIHFFEVGDWTMAHNGVITGYSVASRWNETPTDSDKTEHRRQNYNYDDKSWANDDETDEYLNPQNIAFREKFKKEEVYISLRKEIDICQGCKTVKKRTLCKRHTRQMNAIVIAFFNQEYPVKENKEKKKQEPTKIFRFNENSDDSDTVRFLKDLNGKVEVGTINALALEKSFNGVGFLLNTKTLDSYIFLRHKTVYAGDNPDYSVFFSWKPEKKITYIDSKTIFGVPTIHKYDGTLEDIDEYELEEGTYPFTFNENTNL